LKSGVFPEIGENPGITGIYSGRVLRRFSRLDSTHRQRGWPWAVGAL